MFEQALRMRESLIKAGFWNLEDEGDPLDDEKALGLLFDRVLKRLPKHVYLLANGSNIKRLDYEIHLVWAQGGDILAIGSTLEEAICLSALALPEFLKKHIYHSNAGHHHL
jgi:hypothetical protein